MKKNLLFLILSLSLTGLWISSCDKSPTSDSNDPKIANEKSAQAYSEMENLLAAAGDMDTKDFSHVEQLYAEAVKADPTNPTANFGAALAHMMGSLGDTSIKNTMSRWDGFDLGKSNSTVTPPTPSLFSFNIPTGTNDMSVPTALLGTNLVKIIRVATSDPPTITEMQNLLRDRLLPRVNYALERLAVVEQNPNFELRISGKMQGNASRKDVYLDLTEVYVMDAMLQGMKSMIEQFLVFKFQISGYDTKGAFVALQQNNPDFFVLASDGAVHAQSVKTSLVAAVGKIRSGVTFLKNESDDQNDDIIKRGSGGLEASDIDSTLVYLNKIESALTGSFSVDIKDADSDHNNYTVQISLNNFFNNLPQNPKQAWFPTYTVDSTSRGDLTVRFQSQDYASFTFPDPTFGGLFPGMTSEKLKRIFYIDEAFAWKVEIGLYDANGQMNNATVNLVINGKTYSPKPNDNYWYSPYSRYFDFYVMDNNGMSVQQIVVTVNGVSVPMQFYLMTPKVQSKSRAYINADMTVASQNTSAQYYPNYVSLNLWNWGYYKIERAIGNGSFSVRDSSQTSYYTDYNVVGKTTYKYRALRISDYYSLWYGDFYAYRTNNYTNVATITTP